MPSRMIDFEALWASDKLATCEASSRPELLWLYGLADGHGCFERNVRMIWAKVSAIRTELTAERIEDLLTEFESRGLLFVWRDRASGKKYCFWTGADKPGRLPPSSLRDRYKRSTPPIPKDELAAYERRFRPTESQGQDAVLTPSRVNQDGIKSESRPELDKERIGEGKDWVGGGEEKERGGAEGKTAPAQTCLQKRGPYWCHYCERNLDSPADFMQHDCKPARDHICPACKRNFTSEHGLKTHYGRFHGQSTEALA